MSIITFLVVLFVLVLVHEFGHYITAKWSGMRVDEFAIGFPPRIFSWKKGETEYSLNAIPVGGYVKIYGENGEDALTPDTPRAFTHQPRILQAIVLVAGVTMNILLAFCLYSVTYVMGVSTTIDESARTDASRLVVLNVLPDSPAAEAGFEAGDRIVAVRDGQDRLDNALPSEVSSFIQSHQGEALGFSIVRSGKSMALSVVPEMLPVPGEEDRARVGFVMGLVEEVSYPIPTALKMAAVETWDTLKGITIGITGLLVDAVRGQADFASVAGPIGIAGLVGEASRFGLAALLSFSAMISLNLAVINLFPFPALDGGRLVVVGIEAILRRPLNPRIAGYMNLVGFALLILLMVAVTTHDIVKIVK